MQHLKINMQSGLYGVVLFIGVVVSLFIWIKRYRENERPFLIYIGALVGAFLGAKVAYFLAEGIGEINSEFFWTKLATGKSIIGALIGGYGAVEGIKYLLNYKQSTGDFFAWVLPAALAFGRLGCLDAGCCLGNPCNESYCILDMHGVSRFPTVILEMVFNLSFLFVLLLTKEVRSLKNQRLHLYLITYGLFRIVTEVFRATPKIYPGISGYSLLALFCVCLGIERWRSRVIKYKP